MYMKAKMTESTWIFFQSVLDDWDGCNDQGDYNNYDDQDDNTSRMTK